MSIYLPIAGMALDLFTLLALGFGVGILSGMFGIGGGFIMTPMLILLGVKPIVVVGTGAAQVVPSSVAGASAGVLLQRGLKALGQLDLFISNIYVVMLGVIGTLMLIEGIASWRTTARPDGTPRRRTRRHSVLQGLPFRTRFHRSKLYVSALLPLATGQLGGILTAVMGVGGGFMLVPALIYVIGGPTRVAIGTSVFQIIFVTAFTTVLQSMSNYNVDAMLAAPIIVGGALGAQQGTILAERLRAEQLRVLLAVLVLGVAVRMSVDLIAALSEPYTIETTD